MDYPVEHNPPQTALQLLKERLASLTPRQKQIRQNMAIRNQRPAPKRDPIAEAARRGMAYTKNRFNAVYPE